jgi:excisionase family DNA binding protein
MIEHLLRAEQVAEVLGVSRGTAWRLGREGALRFATVRIGGPKGRMRFRRDAIEHWLAAGGEASDAALTPANGQIQMPTDDFGKPTAA